MRRATAAAVMLLLLAACGGEPRGSEERDREDEVERAVRIARALRTDTLRPETEVLADHGITQEELGDLLYRIATDSGAAARYADLLGDNSTEPSRPRPR